MVGEEEALARAATACIRGFPREWDAFVKALESYTNRRIMQWIRSPVEQLQNAQGRAQMLEELVKALSEAPSVMEKIEKRGR
jgi:hypothetical protein